MLGSTSQVQQSSGVVTSESLESGTNISLSADKRLRLGEPLVSIFPSVTIDFFGGYKPSSPELAARNVLLGSISGVPTVEESSSSVYVRGVSWRGICSGTITWFRISSTIGPVVNATISSASALRADGSVTLGYGQDTFEGSSHFISQLQIQVA